MNHNIENTLANFESVKEITPDFQATTDFMPFKYGDKFFIIPIKLLNIRRHNYIRPQEFPTLKEAGVKIIVHSGTEARAIEHIDDYVWCNENDAWLPKNDTVILSSKFYHHVRTNGSVEVVYASKQTTTVDYFGHIILIDDAHDVYNFHTPVHKDTFHMEYSHYLGKYIHTEDVCYPADMDDDPMPTEECHYDGNDWYYDESNLNKNLIVDYHACEDPMIYLSDNGSKSPLAKYTVGFEVEKTEIDGLCEIGEEYEPQPLFAGWETDSSCGVEGITNVYSLEKLETFAQHARESWYLDEPCNSKCGGHINISDTTNKVRYWHVKSWSGLWMSMFRKRLNNDYAGANKKICPYEAKSGQRYQVVREKQLGNGDTLYELRIPSRVTSREQIVNRFKFSQAWVTCLDDYVNEELDYMQASYDDLHVGTPNWAYHPTADSTEVARKTEQMLKGISKPIYKRIRHLIELSKEPLLNSYGSETPRLAQIIQYAYCFQHYVEKPRYYHDDVTRNINSYI